MYSAMAIWETLPTLGSSLWKEADHIVKISIHYLFYSEKSAQVSSIVTMNNNLFICHLLQFT